jgi:ABC-type multidrug transport system permease subunit
MKPTIEPSYCHNSAAWNPSSLDSSAVFLPLLQFDLILDGILVISIGAVMLALVFGLLLVWLVRRGKKARPAPSLTPVEPASR